MEQRINKTDQRVQEFKTWDGAAWFRAHFAWLKGSFQLSRIPVPAPKKKPRRVKYLPFFPCVAHSSSILGQAGHTDESWRKENAKQ